MGRTCRQWPMFERVLSRARLIDAMLQHAPEAGKAVRAGRGTAWTEARTECLVCPEARRCQHWLETAHPLAPPPEFCRSAQLFRHCVRAADIPQTKHPSS